MYSAPQMAVGVAVGIVVLLYAAGTAYVRWLNPRSAAEPIFRARWRYGGKVSDAGALAQLLVMVAMGCMLLFGAFSHPLAATFFWVFIAALILSFVLWLADQWHH